MTWTDAQHYCRVKHTDLATIESMEDISRLNRPTLETPNTWIGLSDYPESWKGKIGSDANSWKWSAIDETNTTSYQNWKVGQPNNVHGNLICVSTDGNWNDEGCHLKRYFICYNGEKRFALMHFI